MNQSICEPLAPPGAAAAPPLCVDLDGTLLRGDLLYESFVSALRRDPLVVFHCWGWLRQGRAELKGQLARRCRLDVGSLPYHRPLLDFLQAEKAAGRRLVLATASHQVLAEEVARHLSCFDEVLASAEGRNLKGEAKRDCLLQAFGETGYHYLGNGREDLPVWAEATLRSVANASSATLRRLRQFGPVEQHFAREAALPAYLRALRPRQWLKNLLVLVPLLAAHRALDTTAAGQALLAFVAFSGTASAVYLLNDLWDLEHDRHHRTKSSRPLAAGQISIPGSLALCVVLLTGAALLSLALPVAFGLLLLGYFATTCLYSFWLKRQLGLDAVVLTLLYSARLAAGGLATGIALSFWLLCFSQFFFFSLAMVKRYSELFDARQAERLEARGRGYLVDDLQLVATLGSASGIVASFVIALFVHSEEVRVLYSSPNLLLLLCPLLLYWLTRVWIQAGRGQMHEDPVVFAVEDKPSLLCGVIAALLILAASTR